MAVRFLIGIDEVGRGPIAGPLCIGACLMEAGDARFEKTLAGIKDSKQLSPEKRRAWLAVLQDASARGECRLSTVFVSERVIDRRGMALALRHAIRTVLRKLKAEPSECRVLLDGGIKAPERFVFQETIVRGDEAVPLIGAASIVAKVRRDRYMVRLSRRFPAYGFERHKGYGTPGHYEALKQYGISSLHRVSFLKRFVESSNH